MRLLIFLGLIYLVYRAVKSWMLQGKSPQRTVFDQTTGEIDDVMVKDPFCEVYFPKKDGVHLKIDGKDVYFCSRECKDNFLSIKSNK